MGGLEPWSPSNSKMGRNRLICGIKIRISSHDSTAELMIIAVKEIWSRLVPEWCWNINRPWKVQRIILPRITITMQWKMEIYTRKLRINYYYLSTQDTQPIIITKTKRKLKKEIGYWSFLFYIQLEKPNRKCSTMTKKMCSVFLLRETFFHFYNILVMLTTDFWCYYDIFYTKIIQFLQETFTSQSGYFTIKSTYLIKINFSHHNMRSWCVVITTNFHMMLRRSRYSILHRLEKKTAMTGSNMV